MFASTTTRDVIIGDVKVTVRKLSWAALQRASSKALETALEMASALPDKIKDSITAVQAGTNTPDPNAKYQMFDRKTVLTQGIVKWTAERKLCGEAIEDLDTEAADTLHRAIIDLTEAASSPNA